MPIILRLDRVMADRKLSLNELARDIDIPVPNLSRIKTGRAKSIRFSTLDALCGRLRCQPGDILEWVSEDDARTWGFRL